MQEKKNNKEVPTWVGAVILFALTVVAICIYSYYATIDRNSGLYDLDPLNIPKIEIVDRRVGVDPLNAFYMIDGELIKLTDGKYGDSVSVVGNPVIGDIDGNGVKADAVLVLSKKKEAATDYYIVAAIKAFSGYKGTNAVIRGDSPIEEIKIEDGAIKLRYEDGRMIPLMVKGSELVVGQ
jgi:hypothetical protein